MCFLSWGSGSVTDHISCPEEAPLPAPSSIMVEVQAALKGQEGTWDLQSQACSCKHALVKPSTCALSHWA